MNPSSYSFSPQLIQALETARSVVVLTGAGISAESGVPTFRGADGLWNDYRVEEIATPEAFARNSEFVWDWYNYRRKLVWECRPNPAHEVVALLEKRYPGFLLVTQNVDGLHRRAGSRKIIEIHGNLFRLRCTRDPDHRHDHPPENSSTTPTCPTCGAPGRPDIVWFGEALDPEDIDRSMEAVTSSDVTLVIGTSGVVYPVASLPMLARRSGARVVLLNLEPTEHVAVAHDFIQGPAGQTMTALARELGLPE